MTPRMKLRLETALGVSLRILRSPLPAISRNTCATRSPSPELTGSTDLVPSSVRGRSKDRHATISRRLGTEVRQSHTGPKATVQRDLPNSRSWHLTCLTLTHLELDNHTNSAHSAV